MEKYLVLDIGYGDSGKGKVVDMLSLTDPTSTLVVRFSGGSQCGHHVTYHDGTVHCYATMGSGAARGAATYIDKGVYWNPVTLLHEYNIFSKKFANIFYRGKIFINTESTIVTEYDVTANRTDKKNLSDGSCGHGIYATVQREKNGFHLKAMDLLYPNIFIDKLSNIAKSYYNIKDNIDNNIWKNIISNFQKFPFEFVDTNPINDNIYYRQIWEGNQGLLLDEHIGVMPHCTPTPIIPSERNFDKVYLVTRSYHTRHGNGPFNIALSDHFNPHENNVSNTYQGDFRTSYLDVDKMQYALRHLPKDLTRFYFLVVNCMDVECRKYIHNGEIMETFTDDDFLNTIKGFCEKALGKEICNVIAYFNPDSTTANVFNLND